LPSVLVRHAEDRNETTDLRPSYEQTTRYIRLHTQYRTIAIHNKQHKQPHTRNKTGLKRAVRMRNHTIHLRMPIKLLSRMDRRQTAITATRRVSPKQNSRFLSRFLTLPHECNNQQIYLLTCTTNKHQPQQRSILSLHNFLINIVNHHFKITLRPFFSDLSMIFANCPSQTAATTSLLISHRSHLSTFHNTSITHDVQQKQSLKLLLTTGVTYCSLV
jgi:hypothetical protein